jgi:aminoglycoside phosphotransferase (APT) family kinase protein
VTGPSPTQRILDPADVARFVAASFPAGRRVAGCAPLTGGGFAAVWRVALDDGSAVVLKVGPPPGVPLLRYEEGLLAAEARYFRRIAADLPEVPMPRVLRHGSTPDDGDWLFTSLLAGTPLSELAVTGAGARGDAPVREAFGAALARVHRLRGDRFGYDDGRSGAATWWRAFRAMVDDLLADAADWRVELPAPADRIRALIDRHGGLLDALDRPALLHFDGWDGNVLAVPDGDGLRLSGIVDGERFLYGDPLVDLASPLLFRRAEDEPEHPFLRGYNAEAARTGDAVRFDPPTLRRLSLYRLHLYLLMTVEMPSRRITREARPERYERLAVLLDEELTALGRPVPPPS